MNLIHLFDFYLMFLFVVGVVRRLRQYREIGQLVWTGPGRWPRLLVLVKQHRTIFMTAPTLFPALLALALSLIQLFASRVVWPQAHLTFEEIWTHVPCWVVLAPLGLAMLTVDVAGVIIVGSIPRAEMEKYFDQAEYWLRSKTAHVVRVFTLGFINPRQMVAVEVRKALIEASRLLNISLWWMTLQLGLRLAFGLALWSSWALLA